MSYTTLAEMAADSDLRQRIYACVASTGASNVELWADRWAWTLVSADPAWVIAWEAAGSTATGARPGWDASVVTDEMIWAQVQRVQEDRGREI